MFRLQGAQLDHQTGLQIVPEGQASRAHAQKTVAPPRSANGASKAAPPTSYAAAVKGESTAPKSQDKEKAKEDKEAIKEKAESWQQVLDDLPDESPLRPEVEAQLQSLQGQLEDKRSKGRAQEEEETVLKLGLADVHDLHNLLHNLQARIHNSSEAERPAKKSRDNTGAGTAQPQDDTQTNEILHRALGNLGAVVQAHQPQQAAGAAPPAASQAPTLPGQVGHMPGGSTHAPALQRPTSPPQPLPSLY